MNREQIRKELRYTPDKCLLCGSYRLAYTGEFLPDDPSLYSGVRSARYAVCYQCLAGGEDTHAQIEATLWAHLRTSMGNA